MRCGGISTRPRSRIKTRPNNIPVAMIATLDGSGTVWIAFGVNPARSPNWNNAGLLPMSADIVSVVVSIV